jgi:hypothetical protein
MAHFAELDSNNVVLRVIVIDNTDVNTNGGELSAGAETFVETIVPFGIGGVAWKQTSYNDNFRKQYAKTGTIFDNSKNKFISPKPHTSWTLDGNDDWQAPVTYPNDLEENSLLVFADWDEDNLRWLGTTFTDATPPVATEYRWDASGLAWIAL